MADFGLADAMDTAEALLEPVRVPGKIVVHHQVGALEIDALPRSVGRQQNLDLGIVPEGFLRIEAFFPAHAAMNDDEQPSARPSSVLIRVCR
jgi:hypothetical protein